MPILGAAHRQAPPASVGSLAAACAFRWQLETCFDELDTFVRGGHASAAAEQSPMARRPPARPGDRRPGGQHTRPSRRRHDRHAAHQTTHRNHLSSSRTRRADTGNPKIGRAPECPVLAPETHAPVLQAYGPPAQPASRCHARANGARELTTIVAAGNYGRGPSARVAVTARSCSTTTLTPARCRGI